ncbi:MAG: rRNA adenine dimethyltransferase family protein, partial [Patescibacteria group bacterium]
LKHARLFLLERDAMLIPGLQAKFSLLIAEGRLHIIEGDALIELPKLVESKKISGQSYKLIGNIPYYITGFLFRVIEGLAQKPTVSVFTTQKEVAERVSAGAGEMNLLASSVQYFADVEMLMTLPKKLFLPPPKVDSAVIRLVTHEKPDITPPEFYYPLIKALFKQPRKTILNNLKTCPSFAKLSETERQKLFADLDVSGTARPQHMHINAIKQLAFVLYNK